MCPRLLSGIDKQCPDVQQNSTTELELAPREECLTQSGPPIGKWGLKWGLSAHSDKKVITYDEFSSREPPMK